MNILFVCTHNRCRSILSEAIANQHSNNNGRINAFSAGSQPSGQVHPLSLKYLDVAGYKTDGLRSQSWDDFDANTIDLVVTVCDSAANESCPLWMGKQLKVHWGLKDPSKIDGDEETLKAAFLNTIKIIESRISKLLTIDFETLDKDQLNSAIKAIID